MLKTVWTLRWRFWITFLIACIVAEGLELVYQRLEGSQGLADSLVTVSGLYQRIVTARRDPIPRFTAIVEIDPARDPNVSDVAVCAEREYLAHLIERLGQGRPAPAMIAIDKYFGLNSCPSDDSGTRALIARVTATSDLHPVVVGIRTKEQALDANKGQVVHVVLPHLTYRPQGATFQEGVINVSSDNRRLPLQWAVYPSETAARSNSRVVMDTFALAVARQYDPDLLEKNPRLNRILGEGIQPFIGFLTPDQFKLSHVYASDLCGLTTAASRPTCESKLPLPDFRNKIVLIGENDDRDVYPTIVGRISGLYLQANYIEALLDDRFYTPGGPLLDYGFAFLFFLGVELILIKFHRSPLSLIVYLGGLTASSLIFLYLFVMVGNMYVDPVGVTLTAVLIKMLHAAYDYVREDPPRGHHRTVVEVGAENSSRLTAPPDKKRSDPAHR
jgi:CHASE2 domain-containing sensor protein